MFFAITSYMTGAASLIIAAFVYSRKPNSILTKLFCFLTTSVATYSVCLATGALSQTPAQAIFWMRIEHIGNAFIPTAYLHFSLAVIGETKKWRPILILSYLLSFLLVPAVFTDLWIGGVRNNFAGLNFYPSPGPLYVVYFFMYCLIFIFAQAVIFRASRKLKGQRSKQALFVFWSGFLGSLAGSVTFLPLYGYEIAPNLNSLAILYLAALAYAILKHGLLDIEVIIKKTLVFTGLFGMVMAVVALVTTVTQDLMGRYMTVSPTLGTLLSVAIAVFLYDPTRRFLVAATDKYLFQKKEDIKVILSKLSQDVITILDIERVGQQILSTLNVTLRPLSSAILIKDENGNAYKVHDAFGIDDKTIQLDRADVLIEYLSRSPQVVNLEDENVRLAIPANIQTRFQDFKAVIAIPLFVQKDLIGILFLGKKRSDQEYTQEEMDYFPIVASQIAIALNNARTMDIQRKSQLDYAQQAKMAAIGTLSAGISHEVKNPLNHIKVGIAMLRMNKKHGILDKLERYQFEDEVFKTLEILDENVARANAVIERLSTFVRKPKELQVESIDLRSVMDGVLGLVGHELDSHQIMIKKEYASEVPSVSGDLHAIEQVFLNIVVNARHAINREGMITITIQPKAKEVEITIRDTGSGIKPEDLGKIFDPFFTTKDTTRNQDANVIKGTGLGLHLVRDIVRQHAGRIHVESQVGKGTTFFIYFPIKQEASSNVA